MGIVWTLALRGLPSHSAKSQQQDSEGAFIKLFNLSSKVPGLFVGSIGTSWNCDRNCESLGCSIAIFVYRRDPQGNGFQARCDNQCLYLKCRPYVLHWVSAGPKLNLWKWTCFRSLGLQSDEEWNMLMISGFLGQDERNAVFGWVCHSDPDWLVISNSQDSSSHIQPLGILYSRKNLINYQTHLDSQCFVNRQAILASI